MARPIAMDALLAAALAALSLSLVSGLDLAAPGYALALAHNVPLAWRRSATLPAAGAALVAAVAFMGLGYPMVGLGPGGLVWLYTAGSEIERPRSLAVLAVAEAAMAVMMQVGDQGDGATLVGNAVVLVVAYLLGDSARRRRELLLLHQERADQLERTQAETARRAVAGERLRIARELHDVVAHSMSVIAVQAGTGRLAIDAAEAAGADAAGARQSLVVIEETSRSALDEMRRLLDVLRSDGDGDGVGVGSGRTPAPGLDALSDLLARTESGGVPVTLRVEGERRPLSAGLELAAYRIVQEALTNVARHAPGASASVVLSYGERGLGVEVVNGPGRTAPHPAGGGLGLVGMQERAALYGGRLEAGPAPGGGFRVRAELKDDGGR